MASYTMAVVAGTDELDCAPLRYCSDEAFFWT
jgi:hypothetical protein